MVAMLHVIVVQGRCRFGGESEVVEDKGRCRHACYLGVGSLFW